MNTKLHAVTDTNGRPVRLFITAGQVSDYTGAAALMNGLPEAEWLLADRGYDADWFRETLVDKGTKPCIPGRKSRKKAVKYDKRRYKRRNRIERMFGRLKDWRRVATRYDRSPTVFLSAIALAATVIFWLWVLILGCPSASAWPSPQLLRRWDTDDQGEQDRLRQTSWAKWNGLAGIYLSLETLSGLPAIQRKIWDGRRNAERSKYLAFGLHKLPH
jgi:transposase